MRSSTNSRADEDFMGRLSYPWLSFLTCICVLLGTQASASAGSLEPNCVSGLGSDYAPLSWAVLNSLVSHVSGCPTPLAGPPNAFDLALAGPSIRSPQTGGGQLVESSVPSVSSWVEDLARKPLREGDQAHGSRTTLPRSLLPSQAATTYRLACP
jgi:hypothetical protein